MSTGLVFEIKRFAVHDGPGIRTTLFLKGCPLRCRWCHNPESFHQEPELALLSGRCQVCGDCAAICSCHHIENGLHTIRRKDCTACGRCVEVCLNDALKIYGEALSVEQAAALILDDAAFYRHSGGGCTLSGGEPLLQSEFCAALFSVLQSKGIHCAIDTCGFVPFAAFETVFPYTDLFLFDFKHVDCAVHRQLTGQDNEIILDNLKRLGQCGKPVEIRLPLIPSLNDSADALHRAAKFLSQIHGVTAIRILPYHAIGRSKYAAVGQLDTMPGDIVSPTPDQMQSAANIFSAAGLTVILNNL